MLLDWAIELTDKELLVHSIFVFYADFVFCEDGFEFVAGVGDVFLGPLFAVDYADDFACCGLGSSSLLSFFDRVGLIFDCVPVGVHLAYHISTLFGEFIIFPHRPLR